MSLVHIQCITRVLTSFPSERSHKGGGNAPLCVLMTGGHSTSHLSYCGHVMCDNSYLFVVIKCVQGYWYEVPQSRNNIGPRDTYLAVVLP